jgi:SanA protein
MFIIQFSLFVIGTIILFYIFLINFSKSKIYSIEKIPFNQFTLVLGAGLEKNGLPTEILSDRVETAIKLLDNNKTDLLILSGSANSFNYNEPESMKAFAKSLGVEDSKLIMDFEGISTFNSVLNLVNYVNIKQIIIVTQNFHLPRAIWLAEQLGFIAYGISANLYKFSGFKIACWYLREIIASPFNLLKVIKYRHQNKGKNI